MAAQVAAHSIRPGQTGQGAGLDLVRLLADGQFHSGEAIAGRLGVSRAAVSKAMGRLRDQYGLELQSVRGRGYRLAAPLELLDPALVLAGLTNRGGRPPARLEVFDRIDSTNARLMGEARAGAPSGSVCLAEYQTQGRGRRGRPWISPFGASLYLSLLWRYPQGPAALGGVSLAAGVAVARVLRGLGVARLALKWPNDLLWQECKLGGLLLEVGGETQGPSYLVAGLGLNLRLSADQGAPIDQPWTDLSEALGGVVPGRNDLAAHLVAALMEALESFGRQGLAPFLADWEALDGWQGRSVRLRLGERWITGRHLGIDPDGALRLETAEGIRSFHGGEISLRAAGEGG